MTSINHEKVKELGIKPERIRQFVREIENQAVKINAMRSNLSVGAKSPLKRGIL